MKWLGIALMAVNAACLLAGYVLRLPLPLGWYAVAGGGVIVGAVFYLTRKT